MPRQINWSYKMSAHPPGINHRCGFRLNLGFRFVHHSVAFDERRIVASYSLVETSLGWLFLLSDSYELAIYSHSSDTPNRVRRISVIEARPWPSMKP